MLTAKEDEQDRNAMSMLSKAPKNFKFYIKFYFVSDSVNV